MCGIAGHICAPGQRAEQMVNIYEEMQRAMTRRGLDQKGMMVCENAALIHARLCVVDSENGTQPMQLLRDDEYTLI